MNRQSPTEPSTSDSTELAHLGLALSPEFSYPLTQDELTTVIAALRFVLSTDSGGTHTNRVRQTMEKLLFLRKFHHQPQPQENKE